jgi:hypothetical protein
MNVWVYVGSVAVLAAGPVVGVVLGSRAFDMNDDDDDDDDIEPEPATCTDDTTQIERVTDADQYNY